MMVRKILRVLFIDALVLLEALLFIVIIIVLAMGPAFLVKVTKDDYWLVIYLLYLLVPYILWVLFRAQKGGE